MRYSVQHNGKGKGHLIPDEGEGGELCGVSGFFIFTNPSYLVVESNRIYEELAGREFDIEAGSAYCSFTYCSKCLKKAIKNDNTLR